MHDCDDITQICHNMDGTYECLCATGYERSPDDPTICQGKKRKQFIWAGQP